MIVIKPCFLGIIRVIIYLGIVICTLAISPAKAQQSNPIIINASFGFDHNIKLNSWVPIRVTLENKGIGFDGYLQITFPDTDNRNIYRYTIELPAGAKKEVSLYAYVSSYVYEAEVSLYSGSQLRASTRVQANIRNVNDLLFGIIAEAPSVFNILKLIDPDNGEAFTAQIELSDIPEFSQAFTSIDVLILSNVDTGILSSAQRQSLGAWVASGGRLLIACGSDCQETTAGLLDLGLMPMIPKNSVMNKDWLGIAELSSKNTIPEGNAIIATGNIASDSKIISATASGLPLIIQKRYGAGQVTFLASDPTSSPLNSWAGMEDVYRNLVDTPISAPVWLHGISDWYSAANAAQTFPNLDNPSVLLVCSFLLIYMLALGPINYLIVRKSKRRELGWLTTFLMIFLFSMVVLISGGLNRSRQPIMNRLAVIQVWPDIPWSRIDGLVGIYSPSRANYQINFEGSIQVNTLPAGFNLSSRGIEIYQGSTGGLIRDLRIDIGGIFPLSLQGTIPSVKFENDLVLLLDSNGAKLTGKLSNNSTINLYNAVLFTPDENIRLGNLKSGENIEIDKEITDQSGQYNYSPNPGVPKPIGNYAIPSAPFRYAYGATYFPIEEIIGSSNYYQDRTSFRKYSLVSSFLYNSNYPSTVGSEIYLSGWTEQPMLPVNIKNVNPEFQDNTLFLIQIDPRLEFLEPVIHIPSGLFTWSPLEFSSSPPSAYQMQLYGAELYSLGFRPRFPIEFRDIQDLVIHLEGPESTGSINSLEVSIWNNVKRNWDKLPDLIWGENHVYEPEQYVMPNGQVNIQIRGLGQYIEITRSDISMTVIR